MKAALMKAFAADPTSAFEQMKTRRLHPTESVDVYLANMTRLLKIVDPLISEPYIKTTVISGFPHKVKCQIQATNAKSSLFVCEVTEIARSILNTQNLASVNVSIKNKSDMTKLKCYNCGKAGHSRRGCPKIKCFTCGENGHFSSSCCLKKRIE